MCMHLLQIIVLPIYEPIGYRQLVCLLLLTIRCEKSVHTCDYNKLRYDTVSLSSIPKTYYVWLFLW